MVDKKKREPKQSSKPKTIEFKGEVIGGKIPEYMYDAIMPFILSAICEMYEEDKKKHDK